MKITLLFASGKYASFFNLAPMSFSPPDPPGAVCSREEFLASLRGERLVSMKIEGQRARDEVLSFQLIERRKGKRRVIPSTLNDPSRRVGEFDRRRA